uniref:Lipoprotein n=1 Tax=Streptomyces sp. NBC_01401 TaxID=2903854 RepID=A0AAU3GXE4_9ACTN
MSLNILRSSARRVIPALLVAQAAFLPLQPASASAAQAHPCRPVAGCGSVVVAPVSQAAPEHGHCTSPEPVVCLIRSETPEEREVARDQRMRYHGLLEDMERTECAMRAEGRSEEDIARTLVRMRNDAKDVVRAGMTPEQVAELEARNEKKYGNPLGPTADQLYLKYGSWEKVAEAATRSSAAVDQELGLEFRHCSCEVLRAA